MHSSWRFAENMEYVQALLNIRDDEDVEAVISVRALRVLEFWHWEEDYFGSGELCYKNHFAHADT